MAWRELQEAAGEIRNGQLWKVIGSLRTAVSSYDEAGGRCRRRDRELLWIIRAVKALG